MPVKESMRMAAQTPPRTPAMRTESFDARVRDDGWYEVSSVLDDEWVAIESPVEVRE